MKLTLLTTLVVLTISSLRAQESLTVEGVIYFEETQKPVPFAYVKLKGIAYGTISDADGSFSLRIPQKYQDEVLEISYLGLKTMPIDLSSYEEPVSVYMETEFTELYTVVVTTKREKNPKAILKEALDKIPENFISSPFQLEGYYREYVKENDRPVKYADAAFVMDLNGYDGKMQKKKAYENPEDLSGTTTIGSWSSRASSLHRWHFHQRVLKGERAKIIDARSSDDLNTTRLLANVQGGPLSALTKDRVKYPANFMKDLGKYTYELLSVEKKGAPYFLINFSPKKSAGKLRKKNYWLTPHKVSGSILIKKENYEIEEIRYSVPADYKAYICSYRGWSIRHFAFSVEAHYAKTEHGYVLDYLKHDDEFIVEDTVNKRKVPYAAISEFYRQTSKAGHIGITKDQNFANSDFNYLFDLPEGYNREFWQAYEAEHEHAKIPSLIYVSMSSVTPLEKQFANKLMRDTTLTPPVAKKDPVTIRLHGQTISDEYAWLKDTKNPMGNEEVMHYLADENAYAENYFRPLKPLRRELFKELRSYIEEDYISPPTRKNGYEYYYRYFPNQKYPTYYRKKIDVDSAPAEILFDLNKMAVDHPFYSIAEISISPDNQTAAYLENTTGKDSWVLKFKDLRTQRSLHHEIKNVSQVEWIDNETLAYTSLEKNTLRSSKLLRYSLQDESMILMYEEADATFSLELTKSRTGDFLFLKSFSRSSHEVRFLALAYPNSGWKIVSPRRDGHRYSLSHLEDRFYILTNIKSLNNSVMVADTSRYQEKYWNVKVPPNENVEILGVLPFKKWLVFQERHELEYKVKVINRQDGSAHYVKQSDQDAVYLENTYEVDTDTLLITKANYRTPTRYLAYHMEKKKFKEIKMIGQYSPIWFAETVTRYAPSRDRKQIPITLIYIKDAVKKLEKEGRKPPLYITGYGSYGSRNVPMYSPNIYPLLQKGVVNAIAHVRGGGDLGEEWYLDGKFLNKKNTFYDFIDCTEFLIAEGYGEKGKVIAEGGSAGGLLMGAVANMRPDLFDLMILDVPFVDVVNTMLDDQLPLTTAEYEEWGNPKEKKYFKYIKSYSPYENVSEQEYPKMLFLTAINDTRVGYWESAKMVARLRELNPDNDEIFLKVDFSSGHGGASGRYATLSRLALKYSMIFAHIADND